MAATPAVAADYQPATQSPFQWAGLYFGGHVGFGKAVSTEDYNPDGSTPLNPYLTIGGEGAVGGLFLGYNYLLGGNVLTGIEVEGNVSSITGHYQNSAYGPYYDHDRSAAARVRLGYLPAPNALLYASLGVAAGHFDFSQGGVVLLNSLPAGEYTNLDYTAYGIQLGAGAEVFVTPDVSVRAEAIYTRYALWSLHSVPDGVARWDVQPDTLVGRIGVAWHPGWHGRPPAGPFVEPPPASWDGLYLGVHAGLAFLDSIEDFRPGYSPPYEPYWDIGGKGGGVGIHAGYSAQFGSVVAGVEIEGNLQNVVGDYLHDTFDGPYVTHGHSAAVRARLGVLAAQNVLIYGSLGWANGAFDWDVYWSGFGGSIVNASGLQLGAGIETFVHKNVSARVEALYTNYGSHDITFPNGDPYWVVNPRTFVARAGLTFHLN